MRLGKTLATLFGMILLLLGQTGVQQANAQSLAEIRNAAKEGDNQAQFLMGQMHNSGRKVPKNDKEAVKWFRKAAERDHADAQFHLGVMYQRGRGVSKKDIKEAVKWYRKAARNGCVEAQFTLSFMYRNGNGVPKNKKEAKRWYDKAVETWEVQGGKEAVVRHH